MAASIVPLRSLFDIRSGAKPGPQAETGHDAAGNAAASERPAITLIQDFSSAAMKKGAELPRTIRLTGPITDAVADALGDVLRTLDAQKPGTPIELRINSPGGEVMAGLRIFDTMKSLQSPIATVCDGQCASMAAVLLAAGTPGMRSATPNSVVMIHELSAQPPGGMYSNLKSRQRFFDMLEDKLTTILSDYTGLPKEKLADVMRADTFISAQEARDLGIIDRVQEPRQLPPPRNVTRLVPPRPATGSIFPVAA